MSEKEYTPISAEEKKARERQIDIEKAQELAGRARGALLQVAGNLDGVSGMEQLRERAIALAREVEQTLLYKIK